MSASHFRILSHTVPCSYIREYPHATANSQEDQLHLAVKQYIPLSNLDPSPGDITIIGAHANGFPKELYEPLWDDLLSQSELSSAFRIRSIWIADAAHQGQSYVLNEDKLGNDPGWFDHTRDLLHFINLYRNEMPRPIFGVGHSMGGNNLMNVALFNPRLLQGLILLDPVVQPKTAEIVKEAKAPNMAAMSTFRRDVWGSREEAKSGFERSPFYQKWDQRVLQRWGDWGRRECPTVLCPQEKKPKVTLTTPVGQEVFTFLRPNFEGNGLRNGGNVERRTHADLDPASDSSWPFYRSEPPRTFERLEEVRPSVLYVIGGESGVNTQELDKIRIERTGTGIGGSGGAPEGRVQSVTLESVGHLIPMEASEHTAKLASDWLGSEVGRWKAEEEELKKTWYTKSLLQKQIITEEWKKYVGGPPKRLSRGSKI